MRGIMFILMRKAPAIHRPRTVREVAYLQHPKLTSQNHS
jgi:hypothetical protein